MITKREAAGEFVIVKVLSYVSCTHDILFFKYESFGDYYGI